LLSTTHHTQSEPHDEAVFDTEPVDVDSKPVETISKSSLNTYVNSPRDYYFSRIVDGPEKDYLTEGNLLHDFAEFYVNHPAVIDDTALTEVVDLMLNAVRPLVRSVDERTRRTEYRASLETIVSYLDENPPRMERFLRPLATARTPLLLTLVTTLTLR